MPLGEYTVTLRVTGSFRDARSNWLYTAVTRAAERVTVIV